MDKGNQDVLTRLEEYFPKMSKSHKKIAAYIKEHYDQAVFMTALKLGNEVGISESTVVRFASVLGYHGYPEFQLALEECVKSQLTTIQKTESKNSSIMQSEVLTSVLNADMEKIRYTLENLDTAAFETAVSDILEADTVYIMGLRSNEPLAGFFSFYLNMIRPNVVLLRSSNISEIFEQMLRIHEKDCFIGISFPRYSMRTLKAMEFANDRNAKVIAITDDIHSPMNLYSSCNLLAKSDMISIIDSLVAPLSVINALIVAMCARCPMEVKQNLSLLMDAWSNYQTDMNDEINMIDEEDLENIVFSRKGENEG